MKLTSEERIFVTTNYLKTRSFKEFQRLFGQVFWHRVSSNKIPISKNAKKYKTEGCSLNLNKDRAGRRRTEHTQEIINLLLEKLVEATRILARKNDLNINKSRFKRITKRDLKWHPYKMLVRKERKNYKRS